MANAKTANSSEKNPSRHCPKGLLQMMESKKSFSLRSLFLWCSIAAALLAIVGLGYRGVDWAVGSSWAFLAAIITLVVISSFYWIAHFTALFLETVTRSPTQSAEPLTRPMPIAPDETSPDEITVRIGSSEETQI